MNAKKLYGHMYSLLDNITPIKADCGKLCGSACCKGDEDTGMYLFPYEETMFSGNESWIKIYDSDFLSGNKPVKIAICNGTCERRKRPLSCRIFPLFLSEEKLICTDLRASHICPLAAAKIDFNEYNPEFINNVTRVFNILMKFKTTRRYISDTQKIIEEYEEINNIFK